MLDWLSCKKYTESVSRGMDDPLPWWKKPSVYFHHAICINCRRFQRQVHLIQQACVEYSKSLESDEHQLGDSEDTLSSEAGDRIRRAMAEAASESSS